MPTLAKSCEVDTRRPPLWWELPLGLLAFLVSTGVSGWALGDKHLTARVHAEGLLALEARLGLDVEVAANRWLAAHTGLATVTNYVYAFGYVATSVALLVYLYVRQPPLYRWARRSCIVLNLLAAAVFAFYPVAPPRLTPELSIVDTVTANHIWGTWGSDVGDSVNEYAALPSLHFALVLWVAYLLWRATRSVLLRSLGVANAVLTALAIVATGNHYLLDLVAAVALVAIGLTVTRPGQPLPPMPRRVEAVLRRTAVLTADAEAAR